MAPFSQGQFPERADGRGLKAINWQHSWNCRGQIHNTSWEHAPHIFISFCMLWGWLLQNSGRLLFLEWTCRRKVVGQLYSPFYCSGSQGHKSYSLFSSSNIHSRFFSLAAVPLGLGAFLEGRTRYSDFRDRVHGFPGCNQAEVAALVHVSSKLGQGEPQNAQVNPWGS